MSEEIYPMPLFPTLMVDNVEVSANFYQSVIGFKHIFTMPGPDGKPSLVHLRWVKYADLLITRSRGGELTGPKGIGISLNFNMLEHFNGDMDALPNMSAGGRQYKRSRRSAVECTGSHGLGS